MQHGPMHLNPLLLFSLSLFFLCLCQTSAGNILQIWPILLHRWHVCSFWSTIVNLLRRLFLLPFSLPFSILLNVLPCQGYGLQHRYTYLESILLSIHTSIRTMEWPIVRDPISSLLPHHYISYEPIQNNILPLFLPLSHSLVHFFETSRSTTYVRRYISALPHRT